MAGDDLLPELVRATVESALIWAHAEAGAPFGGAAAGAVARYLLERSTRADDILRSELQKAGATAQDFHDADQLAAAAVRYHRAARDQAADENLRILALAMIGLARRHELWASEFLKHAEILAPLSRDELILIGRLMAADAKWGNANGPAEERPTVHRMFERGDFAGIFPSAEYADSVAARAARSGLIFTTSAWDSIAAMLSPIGREVREFVDIEGAIRGSSGTE